MQLFTLRPFNQNDNASLYKDAAGNRNNINNSFRGKMNWRSAHVLWWTLCTKSPLDGKPVFLERAGTTRSHRSALLCKVSSLNDS